MNNDTGNGHMDAVYFGTLCWFTPCNGSGPWVQADLENGLFAGGNGNNPGNAGNSNFQLFLEPNDGSALFAQDATFCPRAGNSGSNFSFMSYNFSNKYIRHFNFLGYIASDGGSNAWDAASLWPNDTTWATAAPWA